MMLLDVDVILKQKITTRINAMYKRTRNACTQSILHQDFGLGLPNNNYSEELFVERSNMDPRTGGYQYRIIIPRGGGGSSKISPFIVDDSELMGKGAYASVEVINTVPPNIRGVAHVFQRRNPEDLLSEWIEECFLHPGIKQRQDLFGSIGSINDKTIALGVPNRHTGLFSTENQACVLFNIADWGKALCRN